ncbi:MAG: hypothetical protein GTN89_01960, partial [Acidobacteria bacterium]|nr:hypothetical protein [Acidobacteriota bacterium]NIM61569.1 hypothetical protein [Acidobacteriota bacterium]NIO58136.1 hypothetical protein [Acidobacteriota bacterium]NIQ29152.1 hypothetical protein [Acidobacteriota bacterium]NIQ83703.1 hypothetical protein [Acidobacteriota bacterium]
MKFARHLFCLAAAVVLLAPAANGSVVTLAPDGVEDSTRAALVDAVRKELAGLTDSKNEFGKKNKSANYSQFFKKNDDGTYTGSVHVNTAGKDTQTTERYALTLSPAGDGFEVTESEVVDTFVGRFRSTAAACYNFGKFAFSREGLTLSGSNGGVCENYFQGDVNYFIVMAPDLEYDYQIPGHVNMIQKGHDFYALREILSEDFRQIIEFAPDR